MKRGCEDPYQVTVADLQPTSGPTMALTAQSFLFSIALDPDVARMSRIISMSLSLVITMLSLHLFTRQCECEYG